LRAEHAVDLLECTGDRVAQPLGALHAQSAAFARLASVEGLAGHGVGEGGHRAPPVHLGLCALGLELVQDAGQLGHLLVVELELVGQEAERAADAEAATAIPLAPPLATTGLLLGAAPLRACPGPASRAAAGPGAGLTSA